MPLVEFFGIGAPRSGTSWIAKCLDEHPELAIPIKETHFFSRDTSYAAGIGQYEASIRERWDGTGRVGEFCPNYLGVPASAQRLYEYNPEARLIAILRNPIDRAFSHFLLEVRAEQASLDSGILAQSKERYEYLMHGYYHAAIQRYLEAGYSRDQLLVLFYEEIEEEPIPGYRAILEHLGVEPSFHPPSLTRVVNNSRVPRDRRVERVYDLVDRALSDARVRRVRQAIANTGLPAMVRRLNTAPADPELTKAERAALRDVFAADVEALAALVGRPLPWADFSTAAGPKP